MNQNQPVNQNQGNTPSFKVFGGKRIEYFTAKTQFSRSKLNELVAAINSWLNPSVNPPTAGDVIISDSGWSINSRGVVSGGAGGIQQITSLDGSVRITPATGTGPVVDLSVSGGSIVETAFQSFGFGGDYNYITCTGGTKVRLPPLLRFSVVSRTAYGVTITYHAYNPTQQSRVATSGGFNITQYITPQYLPGDIIYYSPASGVLQDLNVDGRVFAGP